MTASDLRLTPYHFRDRDAREVDMVLERDDGMIAGIEVKAGATVYPPISLGCERWPKLAEIASHSAWCSTTARMSCRSEKDWRPRPCPVCGIERTCEVRRRGLDGRPTSDCLSFLAGTARRSPFSSRRHEEFAGHHGSPLSVWPEDYALFIKCSISLIAELGIFHPAKEI